MSPVPDALLYVITGGPGSGKTSLVTALAEAGLSHVPEAGRAIIQEQITTGGQALPWANPAAFATLMLERDIHAYQVALTLPGPVILDRAIPDVLGYLTLCGLPIPDAVHAATRHYRYNPTVFIAPHWPAIYARDAERRQDAAEALATHRIMAETYGALGYRLVTLPCATIADRVAFVRAHIAATDVS